MRAVERIPVGPAGITALLAVGGASISITSGVGDRGLRNTLAGSIGLLAS